MAAPTTLIAQSSQIAASVTEDVVVVDELYGYTVTHLGVNEAGAADTADIVFSTAPTITASYAQGADKATLQYGGTPLVYDSFSGRKALYFRAAATTPMFLLQPHFRARI